MLRTTIFPRSAILLVCLAVAGCSGAAVFKEEQPAPDAAAAPAPSAVAAPPSRATPASGGGSSAGGGSRTAAARAPAPAEPVEPGSDPLTQARVDCWMKVEHQRAIRDIDRRIVFVDKCVADTMKGKPPP